MLEQYTDASLMLSHTVPTTAGFRAAVAEESALQRSLWRLAGKALERSPRASAPRLYVDSLNEVINQQTIRVAALTNRVPGAVLVLELFGAAAALALLAVYTAMLGRGVTAVVLAGVLVTLLVLVIFDLDRATRGLIRLTDAPLVALRASMELPLAASGP